MKKYLILMTLGLAVAFGGVVAGPKYTKKDALKNWVDTDTCINRCEKKLDCFGRKRDGGKDGRTACSEKCADVCEEIGEEKGEF